MSAGMEEEGCIRAFDCGLMDVLTVGFQSRMMPAMGLSGKSADNHSHDQNQSHVEGFCKPLHT